MSEHEEVKQQKVHAFSVSPIEQVVLRAVLNDHFKKQVETLLCETSTKDLEELDRSILRFDSLFNYYETCVSYLPNSPAGGQGRHKLFTLTPKTMQFVASAVNEFKAAKSSLEEEYSKAAVEVVPILRARINSALEFDYTVDEIRKAIK